MQKILKVTMKDAPSRLETMEVSLTVRQRRQPAQEVQALIEECLDLQNKMKDWKRDTENFVEKQSVKYETSSEKTKTSLCDQLTDHMNKLDAGYTEWL
eukprot:6170266-Amphidinium_carterae.1